MDTLVAMGEDDSGQDPDDARRLGDAEEVMRERSIVRGGRDPVQVRAAGASTTAPAARVRRKRRVAALTQGSPWGDLPLAEAKLSAPRERPGMVRRARVLQTLEVGADMALTLVVAPAGYGKTTAVRAASASSGAELAWVTLDDGDNDPVRLWTYVATAVDRIRDGLGRRALKRLRAAAVPIEPAVDELMNGIAAFGRELLIVLDDLHAVTNRDCLASIEHAIARMPTTARLIVIARADPAIGLPGLRARGALAELRASELAFTAAEARELLVDRAGLRLGDKDVEVLLNRTEGWPAVLYLAALWLRHVDDPHRAVREFGGDHRYVAEYLAHEVLAALAERERSFLLHAAVLQRFTAEMCDRVLGRSDSASVLAELEQSNMFVLPLERRQWFRVHSLFAQFAAAQLAADEPAAAADIHRRAATWLRSRGLPVDAIEHAAAARDHHVVAELLSEYHLALIRTGRSATLLRWVRTLSDEHLLGHPELATAAATAALLVGHRALERRRFLMLAERTQAERLELFGSYHDATMRMVRCAAIDAGVNAAVRDGRRAVALAAGEADEVVVAALAALSRALYLAGELGEAWEVGLRAAGHPGAARRSPGHAVARSTLALIAADRGWLTSACAHADAARGLVRGLTSSRSWLGAIAAEAVGAVAEAEGELAAAEREFAFAERFYDDEVATVHHARLLLRLADVRCRRGRLDDAAATLRRVEEQRGELADSGAIASLEAALAQEIEEATRHAGVGEILALPSSAELGVLRLLVTDLSTRQIGAELYLSPNTVKSHVRAIYRKLGVASRADAVARATALGMLSESRSPG